MSQTNKRPPERVGLGAGLSLAESTARRYGRSVFQQQALMFAGVATLVVAGVEYAMGAVILLLVAYRSQLLGRKKAPRLRFTKKVLILMAAIGVLNILGRGTSAFALDTGMAIALFNAVGMAVPLFLFPVEVWERHKIAALAVPVLMCAGLIAAAEVWDADASLAGIAWALVGGLCGLLYLSLSRHVLDMSREAADQFQALNTFTGAVGLLLWAWFAGGSFTVGWSWALFGILAGTAVLSVVLPRYLHVMARRVVGDGFYSVLSTLSLLVAVGVDYVMTGDLPGPWRSTGLTVIGAVALAVAYLKWRDLRSAGPPESDRA